jgi:hypothetical protein
LAPCYPTKVYSHPLFDWLETAAGSKSRLFSYGSWPSRIALRTVYVGCTTLAAIAIPFFGDLMVRCAWGVGGGVAFGG